MRAITGGVVSSEPCSLDKAARTLLWFSKSAASHLPSSDCDTYLRTVTDATVQLIYFREELGGRHQQGAANFDAHDYEDPAEGDRRHQDQESEGDMAVAAYGSHRDSAAGADLDLASCKKKGKKKKKNENPPEDRAVARADSHIPPSPEIATEKRKKKHPNKEIIVDVKQEPSFVVEEELVSEKKKSKKKKEKDHVKLEEDVNEVDEKIVNDSAAEQRVARTERERKKKKHGQEEGRTEVVKEEKTIADGDLAIEKKKKKKRGRGDVYDNALEQVEHTKKKQKKHSGD